MPKAAAVNSTCRQIALVLSATAIFMTSPAHAQSSSPDAGSRGERPVADAVVDESGPSPIPTDATHANRLPDEQTMSVVVVLAERLCDGDPSVRQTAIAALRAMGPAAKPAIPALAQRLRDRDGYIRIDAAGVLERLAPDSIPPLIGLLQDCDPRVRELAAHTLQKIGPTAKSAVPALAERLCDDDPSVRQAAVAALHAMGDAAKPAIPAIAQRLCDRDGYIRMDAARALIDLGPAAVPAVSPMLRVPAPHVRELSTRVLGQIGKGMVSEPAAAAQ
jgi:HEAT repeat protein